MAGRKESSLIVTSLRAALPSGLLALCMPEEVSLHAIPPFPPSAKIIGGSGPETAVCAGPQRTSSVILSHFTSPLITVPKKHWVSEPENSAPSQPRRRCPCLSLLQLHFPSLSRNHTFDISNSGYITVMPLHSTVH